MRSLHWSMGFLLAIYDFSLGGDDGHEAASALTFGIKGRVWMNQGDRGSDPSLGK